MRSAENNRTSRIVFVSSLTRERRHLSFHAKSAIAALPILASCFLLLVFIPFKRRRQTTHSRRSYLLLLVQPFGYQNTITTSSSSTTTFYRKKMVGETKDTFLKSIERLSSEDRLTQNSMAKALGLSQQTFMAKAKKCDITTEIAAEITAARQEEKKRKTLAMLERKEEEKQKVSLYFMFCLCCVVS